MENNANIEQLTDEQLKDVRLHNYEARDYARMQLQQLEQNIIALSQEVQRRKALKEKKEGQATETK